MHINELWQRQAALQVEATALLNELHLEDLLRDVGDPVRVGSFPLGLMAWRDIDLTVICPSLRVTTVADLGAQLAKHPQVVQVLFRNDTGAWNTDPKYPDGVYLALRCRALDGHDWNVDVWFVDEPERQPDLAHLKTLGPRLSPETTNAILEIKYTWCTRPEYRRTVGSYDIYTAVLDDGVRTLEQFDAWLSRRKS